MSDAPRGEGWWQASDGKWYPPQPPPAPSVVQPPAAAAAANARPRWVKPAAIAGAVVVALGIIGYLSGDDPDSEEGGRRRPLGDSGGATLTSCSVNFDGFIEARIIYTYVGSDDSVTIESDVGLRDLTDDGTVEIVTVNATIDQFGQGAATARSKSGGHGSATDPVDCDVLSSWIVD